jgi:hypothetical protein
MPSLPEDTARGAQRRANVGRSAPSPEAVQAGTVLLIPCDDCGQLISVRAEFCSYCGARGNLPRLVLPELNKTTSTRASFLSFAALAQKFRLRSLKNRR